MEGFSPPSPIIHEDGGGEESKVITSFDRDDDQLVSVLNKVRYACVDMAVLMLLLWLQPLLLNYYSDLIN